jgi:TetR/AcrR family transcriptional repressor of nem operon
VVAQKLYICVIMARSITFDEQEIIKKAQKAFWKSGFHATSLHDLENATGLKPGSIYNTFGSKHKLFLLCLKDYTSPVSNYNPAHEDKNLTATEILRQYVVNSVMRICASRNSCFSTKSCFELAATDKEVHQLLKKNIEEFTIILERMIKNIQNECKIKTNKDAIIVAQLIAAMLPGLAQNFLLYDSTEKVKMLTTEILDMLI